MMNVLDMIQSLETEIGDLTTKLTDKQRIIDKYERELGPLKQEVIDIKDTLDNLQMAYDSLNLVTLPPKSDANVVHEGENAAAKAEDRDPLQFTESGMLIGDPVRRNTRPKGVHKMDAWDNLIGQYRSVNEAARENHFDASSLRNLILKVSKEKQIRMNGCYYVYA